MNRFFIVCSSLAVMTLSELGTPAQALPQAWNLTSPDHGQTFVYGSEQRRVWHARGRDHHLALQLDFTNDPYVDRSNPRQYDSFTFNFPRVTLGSDGHTFFYHAKDGHAVPVAVKRPDFFDVNEIKLLPNAFLVIKQPHGFLTLTLVIGERPFHFDAD